MRQSFAIFISLVILQASYSYANPTQKGFTGLLNVPTADTLDSGNICVGIWGDYSSSDQHSSLVVPASLTMGIGSFWEIYGSYPNLLFNGQEERFGKGTADLGTKLRIWGKRNSTLKLATDVFVQRHVSENIENDGVTDIGGRLIASLVSDRIGFHLYSGYLSTGEPTGKRFQDEILYGAGAEFSPTARSKVTLEISGSTNRDKAQEDPLEASIGLRYYISPHLTLNISGGFGFSAASPDWKTTVGFTTCQGVGTYIKPVPTLGQGPDSKKEKVQEIVKPIKIFPITPLLMKASQPVTPVSKLEIPVDPDLEEIVIKPYGQVVIPPQSPAAPTVLPSLTPTTPSNSPERRTKDNNKNEVTALENETAPDLVNEGETPLYSIDVKGEKVEIVSAKPMVNAERVKIYRKFRFPDVMFEYGQMDISPEVMKSLSEVAELLRNDNKWTYMRIDGHTDGIGSAEYNMDLSLKRAITIAGYLVIREGIDSNRIFLKGMGKAKLIADNASTEGRRVNRRFEILLMLPKEKL